MRWGGAFAALSVMRWGGCIRSTVCAAKNSKPETLIPPFCLCSLELPEPLNLKRYKPHPLHRHTRPPPPHLPGSCRPWHLKGATQWWHPSTNHGRPSGTCLMRCALKVWGPGSRFQSTWNPVDVGLRVTSLGSGLNCLGFWSCIAGDATQQTLKPCAASS